MATIKILLADDHTIVRDGLHSLLEAQGDMQVVALASNGREAVQQALQTHPDVVIMDIAMPVLNGIEATRQIRERHPQTQVVILSMYATTEHIQRALGAGALGYLLKESAGTEVVIAVRAVQAGERYLSRKVTEMALEAYAKQTKTQDPLAKLSGREREVLQLLVEGKSTTEAADILSLSPKTIETYRSRIMQKLEIQDLPSLVKFAIKHGIITIE